MRLRLTAFFLWGALLLGGAGAAAASSPALGPDLVPGPLENPARVTLQTARIPGQGAVTFTYSPDPELFRTTLAYAVPDTELGAGQLLFESRRAVTADGDESAQLLGYTWGRRMAPRLAGAVQLRWETRESTTLGLTSPREFGLGVDAGLFFDAAPGLWLEAAVHDAFDTLLRSDSGSTNVLPQHFLARVTRQVGPTLALSLTGQDLTTDLAAATWVLGAEWERAGWVLDGAMGAGPSFAWSLAARLPRGRWGLRAQVSGTGDQVGLGAGVDVQW